MSRALVERYQRRLHGVLSCYDRPALCTFIKRRLRQA
jgi:hypothetical protein